MLTSLLFSLLIFAHKVNIHTAKYRNDRKARISFFFLHNFAILPRFKSNVAIKKNIRKGITKKKRIYKYLLPTACIIQCYRIVEILINFVWMTENSTH